MKPRHALLSATLLCLLGGCYAASGEPDPAAAQASSLADSQVEGSVSATFPAGDGSRCEPLGFPLTAFVGDVFDLPALVEEQATRTSPSECLHEQVLEASADSFAKLAYEVLCDGGGDARLCGAHATRLCSVDLLLEFASERSEPVYVRDGSSGFDYELAPQAEPARVALHRSALKGARSLLDETAFASSGHVAGTRDCPEEDRNEIAAAHARGVELTKQLEEIPSNSGSEGGP